MMVKKPPLGPPCAQKNQRGRKPHPRLRFPIEAIGLAMQATRTSPPSRVPIAKKDGVTLSIFTSQKTRALQDKSFAHVYKLEGKPEAAFCLLSEFNPHIHVYYPQPFTLEFINNPAVKFYTPDFVVFPYDKKPYVVEVKTAAFLASPRGKVWKKQRQALFKGTGYRLHFKTDESLLKQPRHDTLLYLYHFLSQPEHQLIQAYTTVEHALREFKGSTKLENLMHLDSTELLRGFAYGLSRGYLRTPFNAALSGDLLISMR